MTSDESYWLKSDLDQAEADLDRLRERLADAENEAKSLRSQLAANLKLKDEVDILRSSNARLREALVEIRNHKFNSASYCQLMTENPEWDKILRNAFSEGFRAATAIAAEALAGEKSSTQTRLEEAESLARQLAVAVKTLGEIITESNQTGHTIDLDEFSSDEKTWAWHYEDGLVNGKARCSTIATEGLKEMEKIKKYESGV